MPLPPASDPSRWDALFADLEAQLAAEERLDLIGEVADRTRRERALVAVVQRLAGQGVRPLALDLVTGVTLEGVVLDLGSDWVLLEVGGALARAPHSALTRAPHSALVPLAAVVGLRRVSARAAEARTARRFGFGSALRGLARDRVQVSVLDRSGRQSIGTIDAVGADFFELAEHPADQWRRAAAVTGRRLIPFGGVALIASARPGSE